MSVAYDSFIQLNHQEYLVSLAKANPTASVLMQFFVYEMDMMNTVKVKYETIEKVFDWSKSTVQRNIKYLIEHHYISKEKEGSINIYVVNPKIAWRNTEKKLKDCKYEGNEYPTMPIHLSLEHRLYNKKGLLTIKKKKS